MSVKCGDKAHNLEHAQKLIAEAAAQGSHVVLLPEAMDLGWTQPASQTGAEPIPDGETFQRLAHAAARHGVYVCSGLTEREGDRVYNSAVIISKTGELLCRHRKINELPIGYPYYAQGDRLNVARTDLGTFGLLICADANAQDHVLSRSLCMMGADIILAPSAWAVKPDHDNQKDPYQGSWNKAYQPVAKDFSVWIAGVSNVGTMEAGPWAGWNCIGCSLVVGPNGEEVLSGPYGASAETILYVDVTLTPRQTIENRSRKT